MPSHRYPTRFQQRLHYMDQFAAYGVPNDTVEADLAAYYQLVQDSYADSDLTPYLPLFQFLHHHSYLFHLKPELVGMARDYMAFLRVEIKRCYEEYHVCVEDYYLILKARDSTCHLFDKLEELRAHVSRDYLTPCGARVNLAMRLDLILDNVAHVLPHPDFKN